MQIQYPDFVVVSNKVEWVVASWQYPNLVVALWRWVLRLVGLEQCPQGVLLEAVPH